MAVDRTHTLPDGTVLEMVPIPPLMIHYLMFSTKGKPKPPMVTVRGKKGKKRSEPNPDDPDYKEALKEWKQAHDFTMTKYLISKGIATDPPDEEEEALRQFFPDETADEIRYLWIAGKLTDDESMEKLTEDIIGQTIATEEGLEEAEETFPSDDGGGEPVRLPAEG